MRFNEIITLLEANLAPSQLAKDPARLETLFSKIKSGSPFTLQDGTPVVIDKEEYVRLKQLVDDGKFGGRVNVNTNKGIKGLGDFLKTAEFGGVAEQDDPNKVSNKGNISEGMLGAALFAKLKNRVNGTIGAITENDLWTVIDTLKQTGSEEYSVDVKDATKEVVNDHIVYVLKLDPGPYNDLMNSDKRKILASIATSCVKFVNSPYGDEYAKHFYLNGKPDVIKVVTDGISSNKGEGARKTDVEVSVTDAKTGIRSEKVLNLSLKAGASQFGQVGAGTLKATKGQRTPIKAAEELFGRLGVDVSNLEAVYHDTWQKDPVRAVEGMYRGAAKVLERALRGDFDSEEYKMIKNVASFINYHATYNDDSVLLVALDKGDYDVLSFAKMEPKLKEIDLEARYREDLANPQIDIYDANDPLASSSNSTKPILLSIRFKPSSSGSKHLIMGGGVLKKVTSVKI
jgi:hypothetical protein